MASAYPYVSVSKKIPTLFDKVATVGVPPKVDDKWLAQYGMSSSNDRRLKSVLRFLGFIDAGGAPTALWRDFRGASGREKLAQAIQSSYSDLFHAIPNANSASNEELARFFRSNTGYGPDAVGQAVSTFKGLVGVADFNAAGGTRDAETASSPNGAAEKARRDDTRREADTVRRLHGPGVTINVNLQLSLPESTDPAVYDALFAALAKHILSNNA